MLWEFAVPGTAISLQSKRAKAPWTEKVRQFGTANMDTSLFPILIEVAVTVVFFYDSSSADVDNILKPVLDGLYPEIILDDSMVNEVIGAKRDVSNGISLRNPPGIIIPLLAGRDPFVYVGIESAMDQEDMPCLSAI